MQLFEKIFQRNDKFFLLIYYLILVYYILAQFSLLY